jgi:hypothetical protein
MGYGCPVEHKTIEVMDLQQKVATEGSYYPKRMSRKKIGKIVGLSFAALSSDKWRQNGLFGF